MKWEWEVDQRKFRELAKRYPRVLASHLREALKMAIFRFRDVHQQTRLRGRPGLFRRTGALIKSFKGGVSASSAGLNGMEAWLASRSSYAGMQERGGLVTPKRGQYLAIPLPRAQTKTGALKGKFSPGLLGDAGEVRPSLRTIPGLFVIRTKAGRVGQRIKYKRQPKKEKGVKGDRVDRWGTSIGLSIRGGTKRKREVESVTTWTTKGNLLLVMKGPGGIVPLFVLKKSVYIPPRLEFYSTFRNWVKKPRFMRYFRNAVEKAWDRVRGR